MILDCFTFFNELDLLDVRLHTLDPYVDMFLISESDTTFQGKPKPFYFHENRHLFRSFESKIHWVPVRMGEATRAWTPWEREANQRRAIRREMLNYKSNNRFFQDHIVLLSDLDEIPDLSGKVLHESRDWRDLVGHGNPVVWVHDMTYYWVDLWAAPWRGTIAMTLGEVDTMLNGDFQLLRNNRGARGYLVYPGGWHFSFLGGADAIKTKIEAFSHTEYLAAADRKNIEEATGERWKQGVDVFGRDIYKFRPLSAEERERLPGYLVSNRTRFRSFFRDGGDVNPGPGSAGSVPDCAGKVES